MNLAFIQNIHPWNLLSLLLVLGFLVVFLWFLLPLPGRIASDRGCSGLELKTITILSVLELFTGGVTWLVALILAFIWQPSRRPPTAFEG
jgi:hypothetical protein